MKIVILMYQDLQMKTAKVGDIWMQLEIPKRSYFIICVVKYVVGLQPLEYDMLLTESSL